MDVSQGGRSAKLAVRIRTIMAEHIYPNDPDNPDRHRRQSIVLVLMPPSRRCSNVRSSW